jgi:hypothetical protein
MRIFSGLGRFIRAMVACNTDEGLGHTIQIEEAKEHGDVSLVEYLIVQYPKAATKTQRVWLERQKRGATK